MQDEKDPIGQWSESAPYWEKHRDTIRHMFVPVTQSLIDDAGISNGHTVLDVATGPGEPALSIARLVGQEGKVFGIDPVPEMMAAARRATDRLGLKHVQFEVAFAHDLPFSADTFNAVVSRFGAMFFPSPVDSIREMLRVLKPGGKLAIAVWHLAERNPYHFAVWRVIERYVDSPPLDPDSPDAFRFATPGKLRDVAAKAGLITPIERLLKFSIHAPMSVEDFWTLRCEMSDKLRTKLAVLSTDQLTEVRDHVIEALRAYSTEDGIRFPAEVLIVSGMKDRLRK